MDIKEEDIESEDAQFIINQLSNTLSGYKKIILETRRCNSNAVNFYLYNKYFIIDNYGKYKGRKEAICFEKIL